MAEELKERKVFEAHMRVGGYSNHDKHPDGSYVSSAMELWWQGWKARAQLPSQGGETVEVVAWQDAENPLCTTAERRVMHDWAGNGYPIVELMTVAQHQRIMAAQRIKTCIALKERNDAREALTHPADQVAEPDAELVELLREARELIEHGDFREGHCMCGSAVEAHGFGDGHSPVDAGVYYAGQVMERIDAELASLKGVEE